MISMSEEEYVDTLLDRVKEKAGPGLEQVPVQNLLLFSSETAEEAYEPDLLLSDLRGGTSVKTALYVRAQGVLEKDAYTEVEKGIKAGVYHPPPARRPPAFLEREDILEAMKVYIARSLRGEGRSSDGKFPLLGTSGMRGIGKTTLLLHCVQELVPLVVNESSRQGQPTLQAKGSYVTFNGWSGNNMPSLYYRALQPQSSQGDAFGRALLASCGVNWGTAMKLNFAQSLQLYKRMLGFTMDESLVLAIDEIGELDRGYNGNSKSSPATLLIADLMREMDAANGKLVFVFAHINQEVLNNQQTGSGRVVLPLGLPPLSIDVWQKSPELATQLLAASAHPEVYQLLLALCGHPRSIFDGLVDAVQQLPSLLSDPTRDSLSKARLVITRQSKFGDLENALFTERVKQWFSFTREDDPNVTDQLRRDGLLLRVDDHVEFFLPLLLQSWAEKYAQPVPRLARHLNMVYAADSQLAAGSEKRMESLMCHYEAVLRLMNKGRTFRLSGFYKTTNVAERVAQRDFKARIPDEGMLVIQVVNFENTDAVLQILRQGRLVVSEKTAEEGVEYLAPFIDASSGELLVAAVQCKFVRTEVKWKDIFLKIHKAMKGLRAKGVEYVPVVYTTADQSFVSANTTKNGICLVESDLFDFTKPLGPLRMHVLKLGKFLRMRHPWLGKMAKETLDHCD